MTDHNALIYPRTFHIWCEGFAATGQSGPAQYVGTAAGRTFKEACATHYRWEKLYDRERNTYWGCGLFDNEADARRDFG